MNVIVCHFVFKIQIAYEECSHNSNFEYKMTNYYVYLSRAAWSSADFKLQSGQVTSKPLYYKYKYTTGSMVLEFRRPPPCTVHYIQSYCSPLECDTLLWEKCASHNYAQTPIHNMVVVALVRIQKAQQCRQAWYILECTGSAGCIPQSIYTT